MKHIKILSIVMFIIAFAVLLGNAPTVRASSSASSQQISGWTMADSFPRANWPLWSFWASPDDVINTYYFQDNGIGTNHAGLQVKDGFVTLGRQVSITPFQAGRVLKCVARIEVRPSSFSHFPINGKFEVIDVNTWTYVTIKSFTISGPSSFAPVSTVTWNPPNKNVFTRMLVRGDGISGNTMEMDNLSVSCTY